jgi:hypothetical protein
MPAGLTFGSNPQNNGYQKNTQNMEIFKSKALIFLLPVILLLSGCQMLEGIFEAGFWVGLIAAIVLVLVIWIIVRMFRGISK